MSDDVLLALCSAATPGPWEYGDRWHIAGVIPGKFGKGRCVYCDKGEPSWKGELDINGQRMPAHVHTDDDPWHKHGMYAVPTDGSPPVMVINDTDEYGYLEPADAAFIAAFSPDVVAGLIRRAQVAEAEVERWSDRMWSSVAERMVWLHQSGEHSGDTPFMHCPLCEHAALRARLAAVEKERDDLKAKYVAEIRRHEETDSEWETEYDALRKGIEALADEWEQSARMGAQRASEQSDPGKRTYYADLSENYEFFASRVRSLLAPVEGTNAESAR